MNKHRTKQGQLYEFDASLGFHLPTNRFGTRSQMTAPPAGAGHGHGTAASASVHSKSVTSSKPPVHHFTVPQNVANRLERACKESAPRKEYESLENKTLTVIYPFMVILVVVLEFSLHQPITK